MPGPHKAISPELIRERRTERQIRQIYRESPIERRGTTRGKPVAYYYAPTTEQQTEMVELIKTLPEEKQRKYVTEPIKEPPPPPPKGIGETLAEVTIQPAIAQLTSLITGTPLQRVEQIQKVQTTTMPPSLKPKEPVQFVGGFVASFEAPVYVVGRLAGLETPRIPPTPTSALISSALGQPQEREALREYGPFYAKGSLLGDITFSYLIGKGASKVWGGAKQIPKLGLIPTKVEQLYIKGIQKLPGPLKNLFISEKTITQRPTAIARQRYLSMKMGKFGYTRTPSMSVRTESWASKTRFASGVVHTPFEKTFAPSFREVSTRSGSLLLTQKQVSRTVTQQVTKQLTFRMITKPATAQITRQILKTTVTQAPKLITPTVVPMVAWMGKQFPHFKVDQPPMTKLLPISILKTFEPQAPIKKQIPDLTKKQAPIKKQIPSKKQVPILRVDQIQIPGLQQTQIIKTIQEPIHISQQIVSLKMAKPLRILTTTVRVGPQRRIKRKGKKRRKDPFGRWFPKTHPIPGPEEMIRRVGL